MRFSGSVTGAPRPQGSNISKMTAQRVSLGEEPPSCEGGLFPIPLGLRKEERFIVSFLAAVRIWSVALEDIFIALLAIQSKTDLGGFIMEQEGS